MVGAAMAALTLAAPLAGLGRPNTPAGPMASVIVRAVPGAEASVERAVGKLGGRIGRQLGIINGFTAKVPAHRVPSLTRNAGVAEVTPDGKGHLLGTASTSPTTEPGSSAGVTQQIDAANVYSNGYNGAGIDVALIDSGVTPVPALAGTNKIVNGPDLSFDSQATNLQHLDGYGHGTHMAGLIAGNDRAFTGVAPGARIVNVKVGAHDGSVDVSQVIAAIDWVVQHKKDAGLNIRVLNLSYGTDSTQSYTLDPLAYAAEVAWRKGIVVVVAGGNDGSQTPRLADPAIDPYVIAVGASDSMGTVGITDDTLASFSNRGNSSRHIDVLAPGVSIQSLRNPNSEIDLAYPSARVGTELFKGTGTSQAAAITSGAVALILQRRPSLTPDQVKYLLVTNDRNETSLDTGRVGIIDVAKAITGSVGNVTQTWPQSSGSGSLESARGTSHLVDPITGAALTGEIDIMGHGFAAAQMASAEAAGTAWNGGTFNGSRWTGSSWSGSSWTGSRWTGGSWSGSSWSSYTFDSNTWDGSRWTGSRWTGSGWTGSSWNDSTWADESWS